MLLLLWLLNFLVFTLSVLPLLILLFLFHFLFLLLLLLALFLVLRLNLLLFLVFFLALSGFEVESFFLQLFEYLLHGFGVLLRLSARRQEREPFLHLGPQLLAESVGLLALSEGVDSSSDGALVGQVS